MKKTLCVLLMASSILSYAKGADILTDYYSQLHHFGLGEGNRLQDTISGNTLTSMFGGSVVSVNNGAPGSTLASQGHGYWGELGLGTVGSTTGSLTNQSFALSLWVNPNNNNVQDLLFCNSQKTNGTLQLEMDSTGSVALNLFGIKSVASATINQGEWSNIAVIYDASINLISLCINGIEIGRSALSDDAEGLLFGDQMILGAYSGGDRPIDSNTILDELSIYKLDQFQNTDGQAIDAQTIANSLYTTGSLASAYAIPEPSTITLSFLGLGALLLRRRRV